MSKKHLLIRYIGGNPTPRADPIKRESGRVWRFKGEGIRIPEDEAELYYVKHADEFQLVTPLYLQSPSAAAMSEDDQLCALMHIVSILEKHACEDLLPALQARLQELSRDAPAPTLPMTGEETGRLRARETKIKAVLTTIDPTDPIYVTDTGRPRVTRVAEMTGLSDVTADEIAKLWRPLMKRAA